MCKQEQSLESFFKDCRTKDKLSRYCRLCNRERVEKWAKENYEKRFQYYKKWSLNNKERNKVYRNLWVKRNQEKVTESKRKWAKLNPKVIRNKNLIYNFGITLADYENLLKQQLGVCAICSHTSSDGRQLCVDHNHTTGVIRGLLCSACNTAIGLMKDDINRLQVAIKYLKK